MRFLFAIRSRRSGVKAYGRGKSLDTLLMLFSISNLAVEQLIEEKHLSRQSARQFILESLADCWNAEKN